MSGPAAPAVGSHRDPTTAEPVRRGSLLLAELGRLWHRRLVAVLVVLGLVGLLATLTIVFATHGSDVESAHATARQQAAQAQVEMAAEEQRCAADPGIPQADKDNGACDYGEVTEDVFFADPRFRAHEDFPALLIGVGVVGTLIAALLAATAAGADWSSRSIITLLTWEPRRLRFFGTRLLAIGLYVAGFGVLVQAVTLGLGSLTVQLRGTWDPAPQRFEDGMPTPSGSPAERGADQSLWPDLLSLSGRTVLVMVIVAVMSAALATVFRSTGGVLGVAFGWFAVVEIGVHALFGARPVVRYMLTDNLTAALVPGGTNLYLGERLTSQGMEPHIVHLSNASGLLYVAVVAAALSAAAALLLRRRDL